MTQENTEQASPQTPIVLLSIASLKSRAMIFRFPLFRIFLKLLSFSLTFSATANQSRDYAVEISATVQESPPRITLNWRQTPDSYQYVLSRKAKDQATWTPFATLSPNTTSYVDSNVSVGSAWEYGIVKNSAVGAIAGYIWAGIRAPLVEWRGKILLVVDNTYAASLQPELTRLEQDLVGDGWTVLRSDVSRNSTATQIKSLIVSNYNLDPAATKALFLFGHIAVPYSGNYNADDHADHTGAWVADTFYADLDGAWTDSSVNNQSATRTANRNVPGDGKFDQSQIPSNVELQVGRVDLANMSAFLPKTELDLLRQYLNKDHNFRHGIATAQRRALLFDGFGPSGGEAYAASGWRNFAPFFSSAQITEVGTGSFLSTANSQDYLWSYGAGGGDPSYTECYDLGTTADFANTSFRSVFMMFFGSYFGDWDETNGLFRAPLCTPTLCLATMWAGRPHWFLHHMALGETLGFSTRLTQNNSTLYQPNAFAREVHVSLMGDPTLRMHVVKPISNLTAMMNSGAASLHWSASPDDNLLGYNVYRLISTSGPFERINANLITQTSYTNFVTEGGAFAYMVRAVKLETSSSGTYSNMSQGIFVNATIPPGTPVNISNAQWRDGQFSFQCTGEVGQQFVTESSSDMANWATLQTNVLSSTSLTVTLDVTVLQQFFRTRLVP